LTEPSKKRDKFTDHRGIPVGYYDQILREGNSIRRLWHLSKFEKVLECLPSLPAQSILDIGCFGGTFLSLVPKERFSRQVGVDVVPEQIAFAVERWATAYREFQAIESLSELLSMNESFDCITAIEVIEHLNAEEIRSLFEGIASRLRPGGKLVLTTPNYASAWPLVERIVNRVADVSYEQQHITKFTYWNFERKLQRIYPQLFRDFSAVDLKKTSHGLAPFLAAVSFDVAHQLSRMGARRRRGLPWGNIVLLMLTRS
jgi:2-polyprenyl-3-methyl-5-hydroxy-6-metoxy-1,4-benzoquinol methylase